MKKVFLRPKRVKFSNDHGEIHDHPPKNHKSSSEAKHNPNVTPIKTNNI